MVERGVVRQSGFLWFIGHISEKNVSPVGILNVSNVVVNRKNVLKCIWERLFMGCYCYW